MKSILVFVAVLFAGITVVAAQGNYNSYPAYQNQGYQSSGCRHNSYATRPVCCYPHDSWLAELFEWDVYVYMDAVVVSDPVCYEAYVSTPVVMTYSYGYSGGWGGGYGGSWGGGDDCHKTVNKTININKTITVNKTVNVTKDIHRNVALPQSTPVPEKVIRPPRENRRDIAANQNQQVVHREREAVPQQGHRRH